MPLLADALLPQVVNGITAVDRRLEVAVLGDVITHPHSGYVVNFDNTAKSIELDFRSSDFIAQAIAADCSRLTTSAIQSVSTAEDEMADKTLMPWAIVKLYYAAYYAGNALVRLLGDSCANLSKTHTKRVLDLASIMGKSPGFPVDPGLYRLVIGAQGTKIDCVRLASGGGPHEVFWEEFVRVLSTATNKILAGPLPQLQAQSAFGKLSELEQMFHRNGAASWLSRTRNEVQYQHAYEIWFRCRIGKSDRQTLARLAGQWCSDPMSIGLTESGTLGEFVAACSFITSVCHDLVQKIAGGGRRSFLHFGPIALLNYLAAT